FSVKASATATGWNGLLSGRPGRMATGSVSVPPAPESTESVFGGRTPAASGRLVYVPATSGPPKGPATSSAGPGARRSLETALTFTTRVSVSNVALCTETMSMRAAERLFTGLLVVFVTRTLAGGTAVAGISTCAKYLPLASPSIFTEGMPAPVRTIELPGAVEAYTSIPTTFFTG